MKLALISMQHSVPAMLMVMCTKQKKTKPPMCVAGTRGELQAGWSSFGILYTSCFTR